MREITYRDEGDNKGQAELQLLEVATWTVCVRGAASDTEAHVSTRTHY